MTGDRWTHVNDDCHSKFICLPEDLAELGNLRRVIEVHIGISEVQLQSVVQIRILAAPYDFGQRIGFQRINAAKGAKAIRKLRHLMRYPIIFALHLSILIGYRRPVRISILIGNRQHKGAANPGLVEKGDQVARSERSR
jgi:hypothetical protein